MQKNKIKNNMYIYIPKIPPQFYKCSQFQIWQQKNEVWAQTMQEIVQHNIIFGRFIKHW